MLSAQIRTINKARRKADPGKYLADKARWYANLRAKVFAHLGKRCVACGFDDVRALQIDHVNGGGSAHRRTVSGDALLRAVLKAPTGEYQTLCASCNWTKRLANVDHSGKPWFHHAQYRRRAVAHLGGKCARCCEAREGALHVDHVEGGGCAERREIGHGTAYYKAVIAAPTGVFQVLCANCNWIKRAESAAEKSGPKRPLRMNSA